MGEYRVAQICLNGHVISDSIDKCPEHNERFCSICGEETTNNCPRCSQPIRGYYHVDGVIDLQHKYQPPSFCHNCGFPFPWTEKIIETATELMKRSGNLTDEELKQFEEDLGELTKDTPQVRLSASRFKGFLEKVGPTIANGVREMIVDVISETAKRSIWGS